ISTDRISCFDVVLADGIPDKGKVLTKLSCFWFDLIKDIVPHHFISANVDDYPQELKKYRRELEGRSMLVAKSKPLPVECIVRGYISGSGWKEYKEKQSVCGVKLSTGLKESDKLPEIIFTPSTKAEVGHDINVAKEFIDKEIGKDLSDAVAKLSIAIYKKASGYALTKGIIIADTKFEFGMHDGKIILIDEVLTPDSSRFWPKDEYKPGGAQPSFDKQFVRDYLETLDWDKTPPAPELPEDIIKKTSEKYLQALNMITGGGI
ncbi:MAG: phosphoribosylaminoimidazolesuccinocarboxamide synthase, partial [Candidatus Omnitrophica bacterium]|nr:phosphoribosylaminoimidazolesuccinocarboxamide synthase [Candidatus Omnitrophota bacterium]